MSFLRSLYDWTVSKADHPHAAGWLGTISFLESAVFPIPPDALLIPMTIANRRKTWIYALVCSVCSVLGGIAGYLIGLLFFDLVGQAILSFYGLVEDFYYFAEQYNTYGAWIVFIAGVTPIPYKLATIASGATHLDLGVFIAASVASRTIRYFAVAGLLYWTGPAIRQFVETRMELAFTLFVAVLVGGAVALHYVV